MKRAAFTVAVLGILGAMPHVAGEDRSNKGAGRPELKTTVNTVAGPLFVKARPSTRHVVFEVVGETNGSGGYVITLVNSGDTNLVIEISSKSVNPKKSSAIPPGSSRGIEGYIPVDGSITVLSSDATGNKGTQFSWRVDVVPAKK